MIISTERLERRDSVFRVTELIAERTDVDVSELPPLYESIDPDALMAFLVGSDGTTDHPERSVAFSYCGHRVTLDSTGRIQLHPEPASTSATPPS